MTAPRGYPAELLERLHKLIATKRLAGTGSPAIAAAVLAEIERTHVIVKRQPWQGAMTIRIEMPQALPPGDLDGPA
jgi:hypothetical protein